MSFPSLWLWFNAQGTWTSGFFPATLYALNTRTRLCGQGSTNTDWRALGQRWSSLLLPITRSNSVQHDVGFISFPFVEEYLLWVSYCNGSFYSIWRWYRFPRDRSNQSTKDSINRLATELADRYSPIVGCTRSWDSSDPTNFQVGKISGSRRNSESELRL